MHSFGPATIVRCLTLAGVLIGLLMWGPGSGWAQSDAGSGIPGLIVSSPPQPTASPRSTAPAKTTKSKAQTQKKPKEPAQREANAEPPSQSSPRASEQGIVVLVNDEPVTAYEVSQRAAFLAVSGGGGGIAERARANLQRLAEQESTNQRMRAIFEETVRANPGKTREQVLAAFEGRKKDYVESLQRQAVANARAALLPSFKKKALEELIEERLKLQEAKRLNLGTGEEQGNTFFKDIAERNKMTEEQFANHLKGQGIDPNSLKARLRAQAIWRDVIRRRFGPQIAVTAREVDKYVESTGSGEEQSELQLHKITLSVPGKIDQKAMARRLEEAETLRRKFGGCKSTAGLAKGVADAAFEDLGYRKAATVSEPTRSLLLNAKDGQMVPANLAPDGVELYAVCARRTIKADEEKRQQVQNELTLKEFDVLARRHLRDLRQDALIEYR